METDSRLGEPNPDGSKESFSVIEPLTDALFLTGPTASGKTAAAIRLARRIDAEIISLDSMAVYRRMDIGTAKPTPDERRQVPHHLIDVVEPSETYSLAAYLHEAKRAADEIRSRGKKVLIAGGTPLYLKGLLRGIFEGPAADDDFRRKMAALEAETPGFLHRRLSEVDPAGAERLHANDTKRLIRALEVFEKTGQPISAFQTQFDTARPASRNRVFVLDWPRPVLYSRINRRVDLMMEDGFFEEVRRLSEENPPISSTAAFGVGYRELFDVLAGRMMLPEAVERIKQMTRNFAKRQMTWFRSFDEAQMIPMSDGADAAELIFQQLQNDSDENRME